MIKEIKPVGENYFLVYMNADGVQVPIKIFDSVILTMRYFREHMEHYHGTLAYRILDLDDAIDFAIFMDNETPLKRWHDKVEDPNKIVFPQGKPWKHTTDKPTAYELYWETMTPSEAIAYMK